MAQKVNIDTLNIDQLKVYKDKAVKLRNTGLILTFSGVGIVAAGYIASGIWSGSNSLEGWDALGPLSIGTLIGIPTSIVGVTIWGIGVTRKTKAEIALMKFDIKPENSMALGVGITFRF